jgi:L-threonylcarbamoyladenylate synthase
MDENLWMTEAEEASRALGRGEIILYPTDTIWGLGCDACSVQSIEKLYSIKNRPGSMPMIVLVDSIEMLKQYAPSIHPRVETLLTMHFQPLTIIYPGVQGLPEILQSEKKTIAIRVVQDAFCQAMIHHFGRPIVSTSANVSGEPWPKGFGEISSEILTAADFVVRHRREEKQTGEPSVIATYNSKGMLQFLRE